MKLTNYKEEFKAITASINALTLGKSLTWDEDLNDELTIKSMRKYIKWARSDLAKLEKLLDEREKNLEEKKK